MLGKFQFSRWLIAVTVLTVAECASVAFAEIVLSASAEAQQFGSQRFRYSRERLQSGEFFRNLFGSPNLRRKKARHQPSDSSRVQPPRPSTAAGEQPLREQPLARRASLPVAPAENIPLPRPRPVPSAEPQSFAEAAGPDFDSADVTGAPSDCDQRLATMATIELLPRLIGPGECGGRDMVEINAILLPDHKRVEVKPAAVLSCPMAESFAAWVNNEASALGAELRAVETYGSYECRNRNGMRDGKISEHGKGNAIDMRALILAHSQRRELTDMAVPKPVREELRDSACRRFTTVLGPGADSNHNSHIHLDNLSRHQGHRICEWDVREAPRATQVASANNRLPTLERAQPRQKENQSVTVGPWTIATSFKAKRFENCVMSRSASELGISFVRSQDGLVVLLESEKWKLDRGKAYPVRLIAGSRSVNAKALAETKSVSIALADPRLNSKLRSVNLLEVHGDGATLRVPLDGSSMAFERLDECFNKREPSETNPFVRHKRSEENPFVAPK